MATRRLSPSERDQAVENFTAVYESVRKPISGSTRYQLRFSADPGRWTIHTEAHRVPYVYGDAGKLHRLNLIVTGTLSVEWADKLMPQLKGDTHDHGIHIPLGYEELKPPRGIQTLQYAATANLYHDFHLRRAHVLRFEHHGLQHVARINNKLDCRNAGKIHVLSFRKHIAQWVTNRILGKNPT